MNDFLGLFNEMFGSTFDKLDPRRYDEIISSLGFKETKTEETDENGIKSIKRTFTNSNGDYMTIKTKETNSCQSCNCHKTKDDDEKTKVDLYKEILGDDIEIARLADIGEVVSAGNIQLVVGSKLTTVLVNRPFILSEGLLITKDLNGYYNTDELDEIFEVELSKDVVGEFENSVDLIKNVIKQLQTKEIKLIEK